MSPFLIYGLVDPRTGSVRYIGRSSVGLERPKHHSVPAVLKQDRTHKGNWIRSVVAAGLRPRIIVLEEFANAGELGPAECFWIAQGRGLDWPLTNLSSGGEGGRLGVPHSAETKAKIGAGNKGKVISPEQREQVRRASTGRRHTPEARAKMSARRAGKKLSPEHVAAAAAGQLGHVVTEATREKIARANRSWWDSLSAEEKAYRLSRLRSGLRK